jgi:hypothetical protein
MPPLPPDPVDDAPTLPRRDPGEAMARSRPPAPDPVRADLGRTRTDDHWSGDAQAEPFQGRAAGGDGAAQPGREPGPAGNGQAGNGRVGGSTPADEDGWSSWWTRSTPPTHGAPQPLAESRIESRIEPRPDPQADSRPDSGFGPQAESRPDSRFGPQAESRPDSRFGPQAESRPDSQITPQADSRIAPQADPRIAPQADLRIAPQADLRIEPQAELRIEPQADSRIERRPDSQADSRPAPSRESRVEPRPEPSAAGAGSLPEPRPPADERETPQLRRRVPQANLAAGLRREAGAQPEPDDIPVVRDPMAARNALSRFQAAQRAARDAVDGERTDGGPR